MIIPGGELSLDGEPLRPLPQRAPPFLPSGARETRRRSQATAPHLAGQPRQAGAGYRLRGRAQTAALEEVVRLYQAAVRGGRNACSPMSCATLTGWRSRIRGSSHMTAAASPSATRTIADGLPRHKVMVIRSAEGAQLRSRIAPTFAMESYCRKLVTS